MNANIQQLRQGLWRRSAARDRALMRHFARLWRQTGDAAYVAAAASCRDLWREDSARAAA